MFIQRFCVVSVIQTLIFVFQSLLLPMQSLRNDPGFHPYFGLNWCLVRTGQGPACRNMPSFVALRGWNLWQKGLGTWPFYHVDSHPRWSGLQPKRLTINQRLNKSSPADMRTIILCSCRNLFPDFVRYHLLVCSFQHTIHSARQDTLQETTCLWFCGNRRSNCCCAWSRWWGSTLGSLLGIEKSQFLRPHPTNTPRVLGQFSCFCFLVAWRCKLPLSIFVILCACLGCIKAWHCCWTKVFFN